MISKACFLLVFTFWSFRLFAECGPGRIEAFPVSSTIPPNGYIIINAHGVYQQLFDTSPGRSPIYLKSPTHCVELEPRDIYVGDFDVTQIIFKPVEYLNVGVRYYLNLDYLDKSWVRDISKYNPKTHERTEASWTVTSDVDNIAPQWTTSPRLIQKYTMWYGCGPAVFSRFKMEVSHESSVFIETKLENSTDNSSTQFFLTFDKYDTILVGHSMCSGAFKYKVNHNYKVRFRLVDVSGNCDGRWSDWIHFSSPYESFQYK